MSNLSTTDKTNEIATSGVLRESIPLQSVAPEIPESSSEEEGEIREEAGHGKRSHSPEEQRPAKRFKGPNPDSTFSFSDTSHVRSRLYCMIAVNDRNRFGSFTSLDKTWMVKMWIDPGRFGAPSIALGFIKDGKKDVCRSTWDVDSYVQGEWAMNDITFSRLHEQDPRSLTIADEGALMACEPEDRHLLLSVKFVSWKRVIGHYNLARKSRGQLPKNLRISIKAIFTPYDPYKLTIWFKAPYDVALFQRNCLEHFTRAFAARKPPLYMFVDDFGQQFTVSRNERPTKDFAPTENQMILAPGYVGHHSREKGKPDESVSSTDDEIEIEPTRQSPDPGLEASQSTPELRPELTDESRRHERDMEIRHQGQTPTYPQPLPTNSRAASVEKGPEEAPAT
ncbi:hypothetical protein JMJ35_001152 [Cladonia borealis]|uniref:Uncharacterized protein n=1 Tax=Cladonia borealis TaxID=184061 RepID=A0AA39RAA6_9LECA|nr:hypothetical protein JMJ35_001152 [Cladonia borealis]